jgi:hypothetical protein
MISTPQMSRHFFPPDHEDAFLQEIARPPTAADRILGVGILFGPPIVAVAATAATVIVSGRSNGWLFPALVALVAGLYALVWGILSLLDRAPSAPEDRLGAVPFGDAASRQDGELVMLEGRAAATSHGEVASALTGKNVLWSRTTLTIYRPGNRGYVGEHAGEVERLAPFTIDDGGTAVEIDATGGLLRVAPHRSEARLDGAGGPRVRMLLEQEKLEAPHGRADAVEWSLCAGDRVVVLGVVKRKHDADGGGSVVLGCGPHDLLVVSGESREEMLRVFDEVRRPSLAAVVIGGIVTAFGVYALYRMALDP